MPKKIDKIQNFANYFGFEISDLTGTLGYQQRKGKVWGLRDRRTGNIISTSSTLYGIERYLNQRIRSKK